MILNMLQDFMNGNNCGLNIENARKWLTIYSVDSQFEYTLSELRELLNSPDFQIFVNDAVVFDENLCLELLSKCLPEMVSIIVSTIFCEKLCLHILKNLKHSESEMENEATLQRLRLLSGKLKLPVSADVVIVAVRNTSKYFELYSKIMALFPLPEVCDYILGQYPKEFNFWNLFFKYFFSDNTSTDKRLLIYLLSEIFYAANKVTEKSTHWGLCSSDKTLRKKYSELSLSLQQCASSTVDEHLIEAANILPLVNSGKMGVQWFLLLLDIILANHSASVVRQSLRLFSEIDWDHLMISETEFDIIEKFLRNSICTAAMKQSVFETSPMASEIIKPLESICLRSSYCLVSTWDLVIKYSGNYVTKLHYLQLFINCGLKGQKLTLNRDNLVSLRECIASYSCIAEPLRSALLSASLFCGQIVFDWRGVDFALFEFFLSIFKFFDFDLWIILSKSQITARVVKSLSNVSTVDIDLEILPFKNYTDYDWELRLRNQVNTLHQKKDHNDETAVDENFIDINFIQSLCGKCDDEKDFALFQSFLRQNYSETIDKQLSRVCSVLEEKNQESLEWVAVLISSIELTPGLDAQSVCDILNFLVNKISLCKSSRRQYLRNQILSTYQWKSVAKIISFFKSLGIQDQQSFRDSEKKLIVVASDVLESAPLLLVDGILMCLETCEELYSEVKAFEELCNLAVNSCVLYCRKEAGSDGFYRAFGSFIGMAFSSKCIGDQNLAATVQRCAEVILKDCRAFSVLTFANHIADTLLNMAKNEPSKLENFFELHHSWLIHLMTSYSLRLGYEVMVPVLLHEEFEMVIGTVPVKQILDQFTSMHTPRENIHEILGMFAGKSSSEKICNLVIEFLKFDVELVSSLTTHQHVNSFIHQQRFRLWSCVCRLIESFPSIPTNEDFVIDARDKILEILRNDQSDPSLRVFMEISLSFLLPWNLWDWVGLRNLEAKSSTFVCSIIHSIGFKYLFLSNFNCFESISNNLQSLFTFLSSWATVSHNSIRLSAQAFLIRIWETVTEESSPENKNLVLNTGLEIQFSFIDKMIAFWKCHEKLKLAIEKNAHVMTYYEDLFSKRRSSHEENYLKKISFSDIYKCITKRYAVEDEIEGLKPNEKKVSKPKEPNKKNGLDLLDISCTSQLKPVADLDLAAVFSKERKLMDVKIHKNLHEIKRPGNLILIASLLEKMTNLGGLSRTAEVQGVEKLVVHSVKACEMSGDFVNLSVTAHKWLPMEEVKSFHLRPYLTSLIGQGYTLIALEQSNKSIPLQSYTFPQKSAVLLGNEKFGVPGDLLEFCSTHLEIPQAGIIRSLNVHVAASLLVWEYSKQNVHTA